MNNIEINFDRLKEDITRLGEIGESPDRGVYRMAFSPADMEARYWLKDRLVQAGIEASLDGAANVIGILPGSDVNLPAVLSGSHLDTVPGGGKLDGSLGVLIVLEAMRTILENNIPLKRSIELIGFSDEEGRFGGMIGSEALCGQVTPDKIHNSVDLTGIKLIDCMAQQGLDAMDLLRLRRKSESIHSFLELHIEQGPVLDNSGHSIGIVSNITGLFKWSIRLIGAPDHAGTTPMNMRKDALQGLAEFSGEIPRILEENGTEHSRATIGRVELYPGAANTVPGKVEFSLDVRDGDHAVLKDLSDAFRKALSAIARRRGLMFEFDILSQIDGVDCDKKIMDVIQQESDSLGYKSMVLPSGAGHDAQIMSTLAPIGLIFVPSVGGKSHSSAEWTHWQDIRNGANVVLHVLTRLAQAEN